MDSQVLALVTAQQQPEPVPPLTEVALQIKELSSARAALVRRRSKTGKPLDMLRVAFDQVNPIKQIGRASCRERV